jgi:hypothetical protein
MNPNTHTYQNVSIAQLLDWSKANPNRGHQLPPILIQPIATEESGTPMDAVGLPTFNAVPVPNLIGLVAWIRNPDFANALPSGRATIMRELVPTLLAETDTLSGSKFARKRRRIYDGIGAAFNGTIIKEDEWMDIICGVAHLCKVNFIFVRNADSVEESKDADRPEELLGASKGSISFSSDPATWDGEMPLYVVDYHGRWLAVPSDKEEREIQTLVSEWLKTGAQGWIIEWPTVDATKEALVAELSVLPNWMPTHSKLKKDVLAERLGRIRAEQVFFRWRE